MAAAEVSPHVVGEVLYDDRAGVDALQVVGEEGFMEGEDTFKLHPEGEFEAWACRSRGESRREGEGEIRNRGRHRCFFSTRNHRTHEIQESREEVMMGPAKEGDCNLYRGEGEEEAEEKKSPTDGQVEERKEEREHGYTRISSM